LRFREVEIVSPSPPDAVRFYGERLGLPTRGAAVVVGASVLRFTAGTPPAPYHLAFNIPSNQIAAAKTWAETRLPMLSDEIFDFDFWEAEAIYFEDRDGNVLELIARRRLGNPSEVAGGPGLLLEISEVGLPVADPPAAVEQLEGVLGLDVYSGNRASFTAVGDDEALFIVVPPGRAWLPTNRTGAESPARVVVDAPRSGALTLGAVEIVSP